MSDKHIIIRAEVPGEDIDKINQAVADALDRMNAPRSHALISLISMAIQLMNPNLNPEQLHAYTLSTSQYICAITSDEAYDMDAVDTVSKKLVLN